MFKLSRIEFSGSRKSSLVLGALVAFTTTLPGCDSPAAMTPLSASVTGTVTYRERIALPPNAVATIRLQDVSLQDVAAIPIGIQIITDTGQVPFPFAVSYVPSNIVPNRTYTVSARIEVDGQL